MSTKNARTGRTWRLATIAIAAILCLAGIAFATTLSTQSAMAESESSEAPVVSVNLNDPAGYWLGTSQSLDRDVYHSGDSVVLSWRGAANGTDFVIPTSIKYGDQTINIDTLNKVDDMQTENSEYVRRMGQSQAIADYSTLKDYITTEHFYTIPNVTLATDITITWQKVRPVYRLYNMITSEHLFTTNKSEYDSLVRLGYSDKEYWIGEGISWLAPAQQSDTTQVIHRFYNQGLGALSHSSHYYSADETEMATLLQNGWVDDGVDNQILSGGQTAIWTSYNEALGSAHHYTSNKTEWEGLAAHQWDLETAKNGSDGVFKAVMGTGWSFENNFYTVRHNLQNADGDGYTTYATTLVSGKAGTKTAAKANDYTGYTAQTINQANVSDDNSTIVDVNYDRSTYSLKFVTSGGSQVKASDIRFGDRLVKPADPTRNGYEFVGWYYDEACTEGNAVNWNHDTMPLCNETIYAKWIETVTVTYHVQNDNCEDIVKTIDKGAKADGTVVPECTVAGARFAGWFSDANCTTEADFTKALEADTEFYAKWVDTVTVTFNMQGKCDNVTKTVDKGTSVESETPECDPAGFEFEGWYTEAACTNKVDFPKTVDADAEYFAKWTATDTVTITYNMQEKCTDVTKTINKGHKAENLTPDCDTPGFRFGGWFTDKDGNTAVNFDEEVTADKTFYAKWIETVTVTFNMQGKCDNVTKTVDKGTVISSETPTCETTDRFAGWYKEKECTNEVDFTNAVDADTEYYAKWVETVTVTYNMQEKCTDETKTIDKGSKAEDLTPECDPEGFTFGGWFSDKECKSAVDFNKEISEDTTFYAKWDATNTVTVTYKVQNDNCEDIVKTIDKGAKADSTVVPECTIAGARFAGWFSDANCTTEADFTKAIDADTEFYAKWVETVTVTYNMQEKCTDETKTIDKGTKPDNLTPECDPEGFTFGGWFSDKECKSAVDFNKEISEDTTFYAKWDATNTVTVTYKVQNDNCEDIVKTINKGAKADSTVVPECTVAGARFAGWFSDANCTTAADFTKALEADTEFYAKWVDTVTVTFNMQEKCDNVTKTIDKGTSVESETPECDPVGFKFEGWYTEAACTNKVDFPKTVDADAEYFAKWEATETVTVTYNMQEKCTDETKTINKGHKAENLTPDCDTPGFRFGGWFTDKEGKTAVNFDEEITADKTFYAKWIETVTVTYKVQKENCQDITKTIDKGTKADKDVTPDCQLAGLRFDGWYKEAACTNKADFDTEITQDTEFFAKWVDTVTVTFNMQDKCDNVTKTIDKGTVIASETPKCETTDRFAGWYKEKECTNEVDFTKAVDADAEYFAKWVETVTVTYKVQKDDCQDITKTIDKNSKADSTVVPECTIAGWRFEGWYKESTYENKADFEAQITQDTELFAKWVETVTITYNMQGKDKCEDVIKTIDKGTKAEDLEPECKPAGFRFDGWYSKKECAEADKVSFDNNVDADTEYFAKWVETVTITFNMQGKCNNVTKTIDKGAKVDELTPECTPDGFKFEGWYTKANGEESEKVTFDKTIDSDTEYFAKWTSVSDKSEEKTDEKTEETTE